MKSCLNCSFKVGCYQAGATAMRIISNGMKYSDGLAFFEVKAARCESFAGSLMKRRNRERQLSFKFS